MKGASATMFILILQIVLTLIMVIGTTADSHFPLGKAIPLPEVNILGAGLDGMGAQILKPLPPSCLHSIQAFRSSEGFEYYQSTETFYSVLTTSTGLSASLQNSYTLGFTLDASSKSISGSERTVTGNSLIIMASSRKIVVDTNCLNKATFDADFLTDLSKLPAGLISSPWEYNSWKYFDIFLKKYGSHIVTSVTLGSKISQMAFAKYSESYSERDFQVKSCIALIALTEEGKMNLSLCADVTEEEIHRVSNLSMSSSLIVTGGTVATRNELLKSMSHELIKQFMNEANTTNATISFTLKPIWEVIEEKFIGASDNYMRGINLEYYYRGFLNYGCPYISISGQDLQKFDLASGSTQENRQYECTLAPDGCHSDNDCHYHVGVYCSCHGSSCVVYGSNTLDTGKEKPFAYMNTADKKHRWSNCNWKRWGSTCKCKSESHQRKIVWKLDSNLDAYSAHQQLLNVTKASNARISAEEGEDKQEL